MGVVHNSMVMDWKTIFTITIIGLGLLLFMFETVSSSATCIEKFADGKTTKDKRQFVAGERASLSCIITGMSSSDMLYWKWENNVMTQDEIVVNKFKDKFNVSLSKSNNVAVYNLTWITGINDVGKYNCTCTTGGLQFPVWIKRPCNNRTLHITNTSSREIVNFNKTLQPKELAMCTKSNPAEVLDLTIDLDCKCTWPEINRNFAGHWYKTCSNTSLACKDDAYNGTLPAPVGHQDKSNKPSGCYAAGGAVTYRYQNVTGQLNTKISCSSDSMVGHTFALYIKESLQDKPDKSYKVLMAIKCPACPNKCINGTYNGHNCTDARNITMDVGEAMLVMNIKPNECKSSSNDTRVDRTECCECILKINCTNNEPIELRLTNEVVTVTCDKGAPATGAPTTPDPPCIGSCSFFGYQQFLLLGASNVTSNVGRNGLSFDFRNTQMITGPHGLTGYQFAGNANSFVKIGSTAGKLNFGGSSWTVGTFFYQQGSIKNGPILEWRGRQTYGTHFWMSGNTLFTNLDPISGKEVTYHWKAPSVNAWHFVGASYNAATGDFYMWLDNEVFAKKPGKFSALDQVGDVYIGIRPSSPTYSPLKARLAGMTLLKGAISTPAQIASFKEQIIKTAECNWWCILIIVLACLLVIGIIIGIAVFCYCKRKKAKKRTELAKDNLQAHNNLAYMTSQNSLGTKQETLPSIERQPVRERHQPNSKDGKAENGLSADKYVVEEAVVATELAQASQAPGGDFERKSKLADLSLRNDYENVPPPIDPKKVCSYCKQPSRGYFKPCGHSVACVSCAEAQIQDTNRTATLYCPKCSIAVNDYKRPCEVCLVNQVHGYVQPCGHSVACHSCVTNASTAGVSLRCPQCGNFVEDFKNTCLICLERTVTGFLTPCGHLAACYQCTTTMLQRNLAYCPDCKQEVHDYKTSKSTSF